MVYRVICTNRLQKAICMHSMLSSCSVAGFKSQLDSYLRYIVDLPCRAGFNKSLDGGDCLHYMTNKANSKLSFLRCKPEALPRKD